MATFAKITPPIFIVNIHATTVLVFMSSMMRVAWSAISFSVLAAVAIAPTVNVFYVVVAHAITKFGRGKETKEEIKNLREAKRMQLSPRFTVYLSNCLLLATLVSIYALFHYGGGTNMHVGSWGWSDDFKILNIYIDTSTKYYLLLFFILVVQLIKMFVKQAGWPAIKFNMLDPTKKTVFGFSRLELVFNGVVMKSMELLIELIIFFLACQKFDILISGIFIGGLASVPLCLHLTKDKVFYPLRAMPIEDSDKLLQ